MKCGDDEKYQMKYENMKKCESRIICKVKEKAAFTLAEVLVAILIMLMVSGVMIAGIPAARSAYEGVIQVSNAEILLSTTVSALRNRLGTAGFAQLEGIKDGTAEGNAVSFYNSTTHTASKISKASGTDGVQDGMIMYQENSEMELVLNSDQEPINLSKAEGTASTLVPMKAIEKGQYVTYDSVSIEEGGVVSFKNLAVRSTKDNHILAPRQKDGDGNKTGYDISFRVLSSVGQ